MPDELALRSLEQSRLEAIRNILGQAIRATPGAKGRPMRPEERNRVEEGMRQVCAIIDAYREALFEQVHSVRVKAITSDLEGLARLLKDFGDRALSPVDEDRVRTRIKSWHRESRQWVSQLPLQEAARRLPALDGLDGGARSDRLQACWLEAGGASLAPPPQQPRALSEGVPAHFQPARPGGLQAFELDLLDTQRAGAPAWTPRQGPLLELIEFAVETLLLEAEGGDRGGRTTFAERCRKASVRDAFALSCVVVFERVVGPKTARQGQTWRRATRPTLFEDFVQRVQEAAVGGPTPRRWALGPDPLRKAIRLQRAWQKLFKAAGVPDGAGFCELLEEVRKAALNQMPDAVRARLRAHVRPWV